MKTFYQPLNITLLCLFMLAGTITYAQQENAGKAKNVQRREASDMNTGKDAEDTEHKAIKKAEHHDIEEAEHKSVASPGADIRRKPVIKPESRRETNRGHEVKSQELDYSVQQGEDKVREARGKIEEAKTKLQNDKRANRISDAEYQERMEKITEAEQAVKELEEKVEEGKDLEKPERTKESETVK
jgi:hypothetical protein